MTVFYRIRSIHDALGLSNADKERAEIVQVQGDYQHNINKVEREYDAEEYQSRATGK
jgi:hypothetical protein